MQKLELTQVALSISSGVFLLGLNVGNFLLEQVLELSKASEEIFRGERLPLLTPTSKEGETN